MGDLWHLRIHASRANMQQDGLIQELVAYAQAKGFHLISACAVVDYTTLTYVDDHATLKGMAALALTEGLGVSFLPADLAKEQ